MLIILKTARDVGIPMARHPQYSQQQRYEFDWMDFAVREELVRCDNLESQ
jgi:hypothetical protein